MVNMLAFNSRRSPVMGRGGMVASSQPLATAAGLEILARGGNAADAAVATAAALSVTEPASTGLGGDMFCLFFHAETGQVSALNGSGRAPAALTLERLRREGIFDLPPYHPYTVTVPGACAGWCDLVERHGSLPPAEILAPAVRLAEEGFPVAPVTSLGWQEAAGDNLATALNGGELTVDGRAPRPGELFHNPGLARTLKTVAEGGKKAFYESEIAEAIAAAVQQAGGCLAPADLAAHASTWETPISTTYAGLRLWECPPNGQGLTALMAVNLLEGFDLAALEPLCADRLHLEIEALRLAFADAGWFVADPAKIKVPVEELLSKGYAAERRKLIDPQRASLDQKHGSPLAGSDTVYFCVVDQLGNACSFINSLYMRFGTGIVPSGWGFALQNRGHNFSLDPQHPNALAPGKRPYHTIIPALITREEKEDTGQDRPISTHHSLFSAFGVMGGFMQPQGHVQVFLALAQGFNPQASLDLPRFCIVDGMPGGRVGLEWEIKDGVARDLLGRGHDVFRARAAQRGLFGRGQVILRDPLSGVLTGGSDPRADGCAMTLV